MTRDPTHLDPPTLLFRGGDGTDQPSVVNSAAASATAPRECRPAGPTPDVVSVVGCLHRQRLTAVLRGLCEGFDAAAAVLFLLNNETTALWPEASFGEGPPPDQRPLSTARADLAALAGGAVVLQDDHTLAEWGVPNGYRAAVCLPVASDETIHGTLWLYSHRAREFSDTEVQLIEIAAGRLAVEHERRRLLDAAAAATPAAPPSAAIPPKKRDENRGGPPMVRPPAAVPTPATPIALGEIEAAGWSDERSTGAFHDWLALPDGRLLVAAGACIEMPGGEATSGLLAAQAARVVLRCHADTLAVESDERSMDAGRLLTRVSRSVWQATAGGEGLSVAVALIDPERCAGAFSLAGGAVALSVRASRTNVESTDTPPVGWDPCPGGPGASESGYPTHPFELALRQRLVLAVVDPRMTSPTRLDLLARRYRGLSPQTHRRMTAAAAAQALAEGPDCPLAVAAIRWA